MDFKEFINLLHPIIGGDSSTHKFVKTMFDAITTDGANSLLDGYSHNTYKSYFNGETGITRLAKAINPYLDAEEFISYTEQFSDATLAALYDAFSPYLPDCEPQCITADIADLFVVIVREAASVKRKAPGASKKKKKQTVDIRPHHIEELVKTTIEHLPSEEREGALEAVRTYGRKGKVKKAMSDTGAVVVEGYTSLTEQLLDGQTENEAHKKINERILASGKALADAWEGVVENLAGATTGKTPMRLNVDALSEEDKCLLDKFRNSTEEVLRYCIENDPSAGATKVSLADEIHNICRDWNYELRKIKDKAFRQLVIDALKVLNEYTYYLTDKFLRLIPGTDTLWFRNESLEEGQQLRDVLQPESYKKRCEIRDIYQRLYPIPEDEPAESETVEAEVVDGDTPSGAATEDKKITVIQHQTNVVQNGENNVNVTNNGTMNFKF